ncbi:unnamed protein product [Prunus armeniaca]
MKATSTSRWNIIMMLMLNTMLVLFVHAVHSIPIHHYKPRAFRPYITRPPPPSDGADTSTDLESPPPPLPPPPTPNPNPNSKSPSSLEGRIRNINQLLCDESCSLECCRRFVFNDSLCLRGLLPEPGFPRPQYIAGRRSPYTFCKSECYNRCNYEMPPNLYQCTAGCAYNFITTKSAELTHDPAADADEVRKHVASCYNNCKTYSELL